MKQFLKCIDLRINIVYVVYTIYPDLSRNTSVPPFICCILLRMPVIQQLTKKNTRRR